MDKDLIKTYSYRISQASRSELVVISFDMALQYIREAVEYAPIDKKMYNTSIKQAKRVIDELCTSLDMKYEISYQLLKNYLAINKILIQADVDGDIAKLERTIKMLEKLRNAFYEVSKQDNSGPVMKNTEQVYAGLTYSSGGSSTEVNLGMDKKRGFTV